MPPTGHFMPRRGYVVYTTGQMTSAGLEPQLPVPLDEITLASGRGNRHPVLASARAQITLRLLFTVSSANPKGRAASRTCE